MSECSPSYTYRTSEWLQPSLPFHPPLLCRRAAHPSIGEGDGRSRVACQCPPRGGRIGSPPCVQCVRCKLWNGRIVAGRVDCQRPSVTCECVTTRQSMTIHPSRKLTSSKQQGARSDRTIQQLSGSVCRIGAHTYWIMCLVKSQRLNTSRAHGRPSNHFKV